MRNPWEVERPEVAGDVITVRVVQALGLLIMDARHSATPQKSGILSIQNIEIDDVSAHFKISRRKYYNIVNAGLTDDMSMDKGLSKLKDIVELAERFGLKAWQFFKAAEETDDRKRPAAPM